MSVPNGFHTTTPYLMVPDADRAISFYQKAFGAEVLNHSSDSSGTVRHVDIKIGDSPVMLGVHPDSVAEQKNGDLPRVSIYLFVDDADRFYQQALAQGAKSLYAPEDQDYGNREGGVVDPFGVTWWIATPIPKNRPAK